MLNVIGYALVTQGLRTFVQIKNIKISKMELELTQLNKHLEKENSEFLKLDYLYYFEKDGYPLKEDVNLDNIYYVIENSKNENVKVRNMGNGKEKEFSRSEFITGNWWFFRIPDLWNKLIQS